MFQGELYGYAYHLQKEFMLQQNVLFCYTDVACKYKKWLRNVDVNLAETMKPVLGMFHAKGHPPSCEVY